MNTWIICSMVVIVAMIAAGTIIAICALDHEYRMKALNKRRVQSEV